MGADPRWDSVRCAPALSSALGQREPTVVGETGMAVVITVCGSSKARRMRWLRRGTQLLGRMPWDEWSGEEAEAKLGFEGRVRGRQANEGRWPGKKRPEQRDGTSEVTTT